MKSNAVIHLVILLCLLGLMAYLWLTPTGNIKPGGFEKPVVLMIIGGIISFYFFVVNKRGWALTRNPVQAINMSLASLFIGAHLLMIIMVAINVVTK